jgi:carboxypeptidase C (cathepsin A)
VTSYVVSLPTLAAIAWSQDKADRKGRTFDTFEDDVKQFADTEYLAALFQGSSLDAKTKRHVAQKLQEFTGLSADWYVANDLKISKERYRRELYKDQGLILGMTDARYKGPAGPKSDAEPAGVVPRAFEKGFADYVKSDLGVGDVGVYVNDDPVAGLEGWTWGRGTSPFADWPYPAQLTEVFKADPKFRVMVGNGWEDTQTTVGAARLLVDQSGWPRDRVSLHFYQGGHMSYSVEDSLKRLTGDVRAFITAR